MATLNRVIDKDRLLKLMTDPFEFPEGLAYPISLLEKRVTKFEMKARPAPIWATHLIKMKGDKFCPLFFTNGYLYKRVITSSPIYSFRERDFAFDVVKKIDNDEVRYATSLEF